MNTYVSRVTSIADKHLVAMIKGVSDTVESTSSFQRVSQHAVLWFLSASALLVYWIGVLGAFPFKLWMLALEVYFLAIPLTGMCLRSYALRSTTNSQMQKLNTFFGGEREYRKVSLCGFGCWLLVVAALSFVFETTFGVHLGVFALFLFLVTDSLMSLLPKDSVSR